MEKKGALNEKERNHLIAAITSDDDSSYQVGPWEITLKKEHKDLFVEFWLNYIDKTYEHPVYELLLFREWMKNRGHDIKISSYKMKLCSNILLKMYEYVFKNMGMSVFD